MCFVLMVLMVFVVAWDIFCKALAPYYDQKISAECQKPIKRSVNPYSPKGLR